MHIHTHTYTHIHTHIHIHIHTHTYTYPYTHTYIHSNIVSAYEGTLLPTVCIIHICVYVLYGMYVYMYICMYVCMYVWAYLLWWPSDVVGQSRCGVRIYFVLGNVQHFQVGVLRYAADYRRESRVLQLIVREVQHLVNVCMYVGELWCWLSIVFLCFLC